MKEKDNHIKEENFDKDKKNNIQGYPAYPVSEDIYNQYNEEMDINPEDISRTKDSNSNYGKNNEKDFVDDFSGDDLDIPGSEIDNEDMKVGTEDEENEYYSLGGDDHNDLDEDKGD